MANITIFDPITKNSRTISVTCESSLIIQDLDGEMDFFIRLSTSAKSLNGNNIVTRTCQALSDGAGGPGLDRHGASLPDGKYANLTEAIEDFIALMVEGIAGQPLTAMSFTL